MRAARMLARGRLLAEDLMSDRCQIVTSLETTWDSDANVYIPAAGAVVYRGPSRLKAGGTQPRTADSVGQPLITTQLEIHLPVATSTTVLPGHVVQITASADPGLAGRNYRITGPHNQSFSTARRFPVEEVLHG